MKNISISTFLFFMMFSVFSQHKNVLVFHETQGFRHKSIETGTQTIKQIGEENNFKVEVSQDSRFFTENDLSKFDLIIFLSTTGDIFNMEEEMKFQNYMDNGGNFFGIHAAADTEYDWSWYGKLVGAYFESHPKIQKATVYNLFPDNYMVSHIPEKWERTDEWYNYKEIRPDLKVLLNLDESTYEGGKNGKNHPIAWYQNYVGGGKSIYTGAGHTEEAYTEPQFLEHLTRCINFALNQ
ncbi:ThuA domain-containing protein [Gramella sp. AN32]|uniref:ThuA domain-containing protein n=1 Tax=Christiangramia antarctica TaxID=2058158 RepID=A0ABW5X2H8_9FLAO|nr:ThuA domain-containing protein [Gramella sp. AN32]MCM4155083.1 Crp/Fnr family transcriptional regulator [Gramella sp. AN32]